jgi:hypothetical protein
VSSYGMADRSGTVGMVAGVRVPSDGGVVVMGTIVVTKLHPQEMGKSELPPPLEVMSSSSLDSSRIICNDGDLLFTIPMNTAPESFPQEKDKGGRSR